MKPTFFPKPADFRKWLKKNHDKETELLVGFYKVGSGKPSITWPESVDQALCFGWIDGVRRTIDEHSYTIRFTPRKPRSIWSAVNVKKVKALLDAGLMEPAGLKAWQARDPKKTAIYSFEQRDEAVFDSAFEKQFKANGKAWKFFQAQPPGYRRTVTFWVMNAKQEATRQRRLARLIEVSAAGERIDFMKPQGQTK
jgi:uncharacterized protein YdeI (YjbR/CyaY-like superfamily)